MTADPAHTATHVSLARPSAGEWWLVIVIFVMGSGLRAAWPSRLAVEHFDEGVYATNLFFSGDKGDERYPDQHLYAPPLVPLVIEYAMLALGPSNFAAMTVNIVVGSLTIPLLWWVGRRWFGSAAGLASALLVAVSDVHIHFSRTALTDIVLCFWLIAAVNFIGESLTTGSRTAHFAAATTAGLAWWTKYNGWLPLAIGLAGLVLWSLTTGIAANRVGQARQFSRRVAWSLGRWAMIASGAFLLWAPWLWRLQSMGGYAAVASNHRGYMVGLSGWWSSLTLQAAKLRFLDSSLSVIGLLVLLLATLLFAKLTIRRCTWNMLVPDRLIAIWLVLSSAALIAVGPSGALAIVALAGICGALCRSNKAPLLESDVDSRSIGGWILAAWWVGLLAATPFYTPYPRLTLPWLTACWLGGGVAVGTFIRRLDSLCRNPNKADECESTPHAAVTSKPAKPLGWETAVVAICVVGAMSFWVAGARLPGVPGWQPRTSLAEQAPLLIDGACRNAGAARTGALDEFVIYTCGEPALVFQLRLAGVRWVRPVKDLAVADSRAPSPRLPSFIVVGPQSHRTAGFVEQFAGVRNRLDLVGTYTYHPSELVMLDRSDLRETQVEEELELYRVK